MVSSKEKAEEFEVLYTAYIAKLRRFDELQAKGRYGYQLRMPKKALHKAIDMLRTWGQQNEVEIESLFY